MTKAKSDAAARKNSASDAPGTGKRNFMRFDADPNELAWIAFNTTEKVFRAEQVALVYNESYTGFSLVMLCRKTLAVGLPIVAQIGRAAPTPAEVRWLKELSPGVWQIGCLFVK